jgi:GDP-4-dehydro-6-deoxy-D-mannose reductase
MKRDFTDVRDVVSAYLHLADSAQPGQAYLICSGRPVPVQELLDTLVELAGVEVKVVYDRRRGRPTAIPCLYGSYAKIAQHTGWQPQISLRHSLADTLADWEGRLRD